MEPLVKQCNRCREMFEYDPTPGRPGPTYCPRCRLERHEAAQQRTRARMRQAREERKAQHTDERPLH